MFDGKSGDQASCSGSVAGPFVHLGNLHSFSFPLIPFPRLEMEDADKHKNDRTFLVCQPALLWQMGRK